ncbi:MAG: V-type ATP synthase subunit F [Thermoplasmata archaeon]
MPERTDVRGRTVVLGERELAIGFRLIGLRDVREVTPEDSVVEFEKVLRADDVGLLIASQSIRPRLSDAERTRADASLRPLVVFVPTPTGEFEVESINALAKRVLGVTLAVSS